MKALAKCNKGVAGLEILLTVIVSLFLLGLIVMIFALSGNEIEEAIYDPASGAINNETLTTVTEAGESLTAATLINVACEVGTVTNATGGETLIAANYTVDTTLCTVSTNANTDTGYNNSNLNVSYTYTHENPTTASGVINDTVNTVADVTDWFQIIIVIAAMVVLILLTVIIITAIRGSGITSAGGSGGAGSRTGGTA